MAKKFGAKSTLYTTLFIALVSFAFYKYNHMPKYDLGEQLAYSGEYSDTDNYINVSPMKRDISKQLTIAFLTMFIVFFTIEILGSGGMEGFFDWNDFLSFQNFRDFRLSIFGQSLISILAYIVYYQIIQPFVVNKIPKF